jgi:hypothetical protein
MRPALATATRSTISKGSPFSLHKQLFVKLGVIASAAVRAPTMVIDAITQREIDDLLSKVTSR